LHHRIFKFFSLISSQRKDFLIHNICAQKNQCQIPKLQYKEQNLLNDLEGDRSLTEKLTLNGIMKNVENGENDP